MSQSFVDPTPRWRALRGSPELRPYNSLPRGQDINNYPSLVLHQTNLKNQHLSCDSSSSPPRRRSPTRRTHSEDVYNERGISPIRADVKENEEKEIKDLSAAENTVKRQVRVNPLMRLAENKQDKGRTSSPRRKSQKTEAKENMKHENVEQDKGMV
ncbi:hypothetical protein NQ314_012909 [Rhamnusium bicolor]|uniref:Uncharacterized protein n=1 Tax=Rhamnusium bicolor TaxID=1586634 RepID=A0AAV8X9M1_9CUCU|nr:hypothetical protein NQ314_012909 [Rhamnusium bicolor]